MNAMFRVVVAGAFLVLISAKLHATLLLVIPCNGGVVVAADSAAAIGPSLTGEGEPIISVKSKWRFSESFDKAFAVSGIAGFAGPGTNSFFAIDVLSSELFRHGEINADLINACSNRIRRDITEAFNRNSDALQTLKGRTMCRATIVHIGHADATTTIQALNIGVAADGKVEITADKINRYSQSTAKWFDITGESTFAAENVIRPGSEGRKLLSKEVLATAETPGAVSSISQFEAREVADSLVRATEQRMKAQKVPVTVAAPIAAFFLDGKSVPKKL